MLEELRAVVRDDVGDPGIAGVRLTALELSVDYRHARVHFALPPDVSRADAERSFGRASSFLRRRVAESIEFKRVPELRFVCDGVSSTTTIGVGDDER
jgi:ribosome-binding factor A